MTLIPNAAPVVEAAAEEQQTPRILTWDEYSNAYGNAVSALGARSHNPGSEAVFAALDAALYALGILPPPPEPDADTCPAQFASLEGEWHQCGDEPGHDPAEGHSDGEWSWPDGDRYATPEGDEQAPE
ncbi:hypothetical protein ACWEQC_00330 [Streptomyces shenzhenensis]